MAEIKTIHLCNPFLRCCNTCTAVTSFACFDIVLIPLTKRVVTVGQLQKVSTFWGESYVKFELDCKAKTLSEETVQISRSYQFYSPTSAQGIVKLRISDAFVNFISVLFIPCMKKKQVNKRYILLKRRYKYSFLVFYSL